MCDINKKDWKLRFVRAACFFFLQCYCCIPSLFLFASICARPHVSMCVACVSAYPAPVFQCEAMWSQMVLPVPVAVNISGTSWAAGITDSGYALASQWAEVACVHSSCRSLFFYSQKCCFVFDGVFLGIYVCRYWDTHIQPASVPIVLSRTLTLPQGRM